MMKSSQILLVEDEETIRFTLSLSLELEGFSVAVAANGQEALDLLSGGLRPGLILLDLMMPVMDGWQFAEILAADNGLASIPIVLLTAYSGRGKELQVKGVIRKPVDLEILFETVRQYCGPPFESELRVAG